MSEKITLKSGLEIHQQIDAGKLFCNCPAILRQDKPDYEVTRELHAVAGESGKVDEAAVFEAGQRKKFIYQGWKDTCCLVELDESPPYPINKEALKIALQIALLLNCEIIPYTQIMRKTVINGSNTSGFQRTAMIAWDGYVETSFGKVKIDYVFLEEDSARPARGKASSSNTQPEDDDPEDEASPNGAMPKATHSGTQPENSKTYKLDRLGIPLVEIATSPDMSNPEQIKEAALKIGEILRACKVRRGIGTIRQDLNISIEGSERVEIKGFQDPKTMIKTVELEVARQHECLKKKICQKEVRKANPDGTTSFLRPMPGASRMYPETDLPLLHISREEINEAKKDLPRMKHEIREELKASGLGEEMVKLILDAGKLEEYKELLEIWKKPDLIAKLLVLWKKEISSREKIPEEKIEKAITIDIIESILNLIRQEKIDESQAKKIMLDIVQGKNPNEALKIEKVGNLEDEVLKIVKEKPGLNVNAYMGLVMAKFKGKVSGKEVMEILKKIVK